MTTPKSVATTSRTRWAATARRRSQRRSYPDRLISRQRARPPLIGLSRRAAPPSRHHAKIANARLSAPSVPICGRILGLSPSPEPSPMPAENRSDPRTEPATPQPPKFPGPSRTRATQNFVRPNPTARSRADSRNHPAGANIPPEQIRTQARNDTNEPTGSRDRPDQAAVHVRTRAVSMHERTQASAHARTNRATSVHAPTQAAPGSMIEPCLAPCTYGPGKPDLLRRLRPARTPAFEPEFRLVDAALPSDRLDRVAPLIRGRIAGIERIDTTLGTDGKPIPTSRRRRRVGRLPPRACRMRRQLARHAQQPRRIADLSSVAAQLLGGSQAGGNCRSLVWRGWPSARPIRG